MYLLRRHFGIGYAEWRDQLPEWYVELLLDGLQDEHEADREPSEGGID